jgi:hypothetical protein
MKQSFQTLSVPLEDVEVFVNTLVFIFEKQLPFTSLAEENSTLEISFQILYPEIKSESKTSVTCRPSDRLSLPRETPIFKGQQE